MFVSLFSLPDLPLKSSLGDSVNGELGPCNSDAMGRIPHLTGLEVIARTGMKFQNAEAYGVIQ